jgi:predicted nucleic acid-binding protein
LTPSLGLADAAFRLALSTRASLYDSLFLALALELGLPLVTADLKLVERVRAHAPEITCLTLADL